MQIKQMINVKEKSVCCQVSFQSPVSLSSVDEAIMITCIQTHAYLKDSWMLCYFFSLERSKNVLSCHSCMLAIMTCRDGCELVRSIALNTPME